MDNEHTNIIDRDWRIRAITTLTKDCKSPSGTVFKTGAPVVAGTFVEYATENIGITLPDPSAIYISIASRASNQGDDYITNNFLDNCVIFKDGHKTLNPEFESVFFDALENQITCIICSYSAIEVFANNSIPDDFHYIKERTNKCGEKYSKEQIERFINLDEKLDKILPGIFSVQSPSGTVIWQKYVWLKKLRDRLIHLKSRDWKSSESEATEYSLWTSLLSKEVINAPDIALSIIEHYLPKDKLRWIIKYRINK